MTTFNAGTAIAGGLLIGAAAVLLLALNGRIAGISGIVNGVLRERDGRGWRLAFALGLVAGAAIAAAFGLAAKGAVGVTSHTVVAVAGLLVGAGTTLGGGCTSGHGVCGIARLSRRSLVATLVFMAAGMATVFVVRHVLG